jgi:predicted DNA-binding antitoxin AbrB/MazE fold protein
VTRSLKAVYENGVLRPLEPLPFKQHELVTVTITDSQPTPEEWLDDEFLRAVEAEADESITLGEVRAALAKIPGSMAEDIRRGRDDRL